MTQKIKIRDQSLCLTFQELVFCENLLAAAGSRLVVELVKVKICTPLQDSVVVEPVGLAVRHMSS
jgi:hypothetical protein